jgi:hypothetical protein
MYVERIESSWQYTRWQSGTKCVLAPDSPLNQKRTDTTYRMVGMSAG